MNKIRYILKKIVWITVQFKINRKNNILTIMKILGIKVAQILMW